VSIHDDGLGPVEVTNRLGREIPQWLAERSRNVSGLILSGRENIEDYRT
jgi:hypothetical protein